MAHRMIVLPGIVRLDSIDFPDIRGSLSFVLRAVGFDWCSRGNSHQSFEDSVLLVQRCQFPPIT